MVSVNDLAPYVNQGVMIAIIIGIGLFVCIGGFLIIHIMRHRVIIRVHKKTASKTLILEEFRARLVREKEHSLIKPLNPFIKWMANIKPPNNPYTWYIQGSKMVLNLYQQAEGTYQYITFAKKPDKDPEYLLIDEDMRLWTAMQLKETSEKYKKLGFMEKYGQIISIGIIVVFFIIALILTIQMIKDIAPQAIQAQKDLGLAVINQTSQTIR